MEHFNRSSHFITHNTSHYSICQNFFEKGLFAEIYYLFWIGTIAGVSPSYAVAKLIHRIGQLYRDWNSVLSVCWKEPCRQNNKVRIFWECHKVRNYWVTSKKVGYFVFKFLLHSMKIWTLAIQSFTSSLVIQNAVFH